MSMDSSAENQLISHARRGDLDAFNQLVLAYQNRVYTLTYRIMGDEAGAADTAQDTFITAYRRLDTYRGGSFKSWLLRIATNTCYDELRRRKRRPATSFEDLTPPETNDGPPIASDAPSPEEEAEQSELSRAIQDCIKRLGDDQRMVLVLSDIEGYSYQEIAAMVDVKTGTVKSRLSRARLNMRDCLQAFKELLPSVFRLDDN
jgi:RNA polymerase sigma-70 factor, ECF subfamily